MSCGSFNTPDCNCAVCLVLRRLDRDSHRPGLPFGIKPWLCEQLRWVHGALLDRLENPALGIPGGDLPPLPPVAAGGKGATSGTRSEAPGNQESSPTKVIPVKTEGSCETEPVAEPPEGEGATPVEKGENPDPGHQGGAAEETRDTEEEDKAEAEGSEKQPAEEKGLEEEEKRSPTPRARSSGVKRKCEKSPKKKEKKKERSKRSPGPSPEREDRQRRRTKSPLRPRSPDHPPRKPRSPDHPPPPPRERPTFPKTIPSGRTNPVLREPQRPPGQWGGQWVGKQKGRVRRERWKDIQTYGASDERKKQREERHHR